MYSTRPRQEPDGLGVLPVWAQIITAVGSVAAPIVAARLARPSSPKQEEIESQIKLQQDFEIKRIFAQQQQSESLMRYALPAAGVLALVMLLKR